MVNVEIFFNQNLSRQAKEGDEFDYDQTREEGRDHLKWRLIKTQ